MARFEIEANGKRYEVDAPDMATAVRALGGGRDFGMAAETGDSPDVQAAYARANPRGSAMSPLAQGMTLGLGDEIIGGVGGLASLVGGKGFGEGYTKTRDAVRGDLDNYRQRHPTLSTVLEAGGSLTTAGLPIGRVAQGAGLLAKMGKGALAGAGMGGVYGAASADGDMLDRVKGGASGAGVGLAMGGGLPVLGAATKAIGKPFVDAVSARINPAGAAATKLTERITGSGRTIEGVATRIERAAAQGQNLNVADAGGRGAQTLARTVANTPGKGADRIAARTNLSAMAQGDRLKHLVSEAFEAPEGAYQAAKASVMDARSHAAAPYYERAYARGVPFTHGLEEMLNTPAGRAGLAAARRNSANRREPWAAWFANVADDGSIIDLRNVPDTRALDEVKRVLDDMVESAKKPADGSPFAKAKATPESIAIQSVRDDLRGFLRRENPDYARAMDVGMSNIQADEALEFGRMALNTDARVIAQRMGSATGYGRDRVFNEGQRELARVGLAEGIRDRLDKAGMTHNGLLKFFSTKEQVNRIKPFFRNERDFTAFRSMMFNEARKRKTLDFVRSNSTTARQLADLQDAGQMGDTIGVVAQAATGGPMAAALSVLQRGLRRIGGLTPQVADEMGKLLMTAEPNAVRGIIGQLRMIEGSKAKAAVKADKIRALLTNFASAQAGRQLAPQQNPQMGVQ